MKNFIKIFAVLTFLSIVLAFACNSKNDTSSNANQTQNVEKQTYKSVGVIKKIDAEKGEITVDHEDISGYMSAIQMTNLPLTKRCPIQLKSFIKSNSRSNEPAQMSFLSDECDKPAQAINIKLNT